MVCDVDDTQIHPRIVQERLGHAKVSITLDTHSHDGLDMRAAAACGSVTTGDENDRWRRSRKPCTYGNVVASWRVLHRIASLQVSRCVTELLMSPPTRVGSAFRTVWRVGPMSRA